MIADDRTGGQAASGTHGQGECMAIRHATAPTEGVQFHPESFLTPDGTRLMTNFLTQVGRVITGHVRTPDGNPG